ncbi:hypothetical protein NC652_021540 [Populus alba x Populus x berolinensis]|nr:hypothetical protein NC652_021540 [Populus alba x Populus x berolinensis]
MLDDKVSGLMDKHHGRSNALTKPHHKRHSPPLYGKLILHKYANKSSNPNLEWIFFFNSDCNFFN